VRQFLAKAIIVFLAVVVATILIAPSVNLDPAAPRLEWAACLLVVFVSWLAVIFECRLWLRASGPLLQTDNPCSSDWLASAALPWDGSSSFSPRC
jgi:hypothetical protein